MASHAQDTILQFCRYGCGASTSKNERFLHDNNVCPNSKWGGPHAYVPIEVQKAFLKQRFPATRHSSTKTNPNHVYAQSQNNDDAPVYRGRGPLNNDDHNNDDGDLDDDQYYNMSMRSNKKNPNHVYLDAPPNNDDNNNDDDDTKTAESGLKCCACGATHRKLVKFCPECGHKVDESKPKMNKWTQRRNQLKNMRVSNLKHLCQQYGINHNGLFEKCEFIDAILAIELEHDSDEEGCNGEEAEEGDNEEKEVVSSAHESKGIGIQRPTYCK
eukprot:270288_1